MKYSAILIALLTACCSVPPVEQPPGIVVSGTPVPNPLPAMPHTAPTAPQPSAIERKLDDIDASIKRLDDTLKQRGE